MKNIIKFYWITLIILFISTSTWAQTEPLDPVVTNKQAKKEQKAEQKREKQKVKEIKISKKEAERDVTKKRFQFFFKRRKKAAPKSLGNPEHKQ